MKDSGGPPGPDLLPTGVVDQQLDPAEPGHDRLHRLLHPQWQGDVQRVAVRAPAAGTDLLAHLQGRRASLSAQTETESGKRRATAAAVGGGRGGGTAEMAWTSRSRTQTWQPRSRARTAATPRPIPRPAPVTTATGFCPRSWRRGGPRSRARGGGAGSVPAHAAAGAERAETEE